MSDDLISRQAAIDEIGEKADEIYKTKQKGATYPHDDFFQGMAYAEDVVRQLPSAEPEIIRCKDCKHRYIEGMTWRCPFGLMGGENFFCGYGSLGTVEVEGLLSAETVRMKGWWATDSYGAMDDGEYLVTRCSVCGMAYEYGHDDRYCGFCGAEMMGDTDE